MPSGWWARAWSRSGVGAGPAEHRPGPGIMAAAAECQGQVVGQTAGHPGWYSAVAEKNALHNKEVRIQRPSNKKEKVQLRGGLSWSNLKLENLKRHINWGHHLCF